MKSAIRATATLIAGCLALAHSATAVTPSQARFEERLGATSGTNVFLPEHLVIDQADFHGEATTSGVGPYAEVVLTRDWSTPLRAGAYARVQYFFAVEGPPLPAHIAAVPVIVDAMLVVEGGGGILSNDRNTALASIWVIVPDADYSQLEQISVCSQVDPVCVDRREANLSFNFGMTPGGPQGWIYLTASIDFIPYAGWPGSLRAVADPYIYIDPAFENANGYRVVVSSAVANGPPVPEPPSLLLLSAGLATLWARRSRRASTAWLTA